MKRWIAVIPLLVIAGFSLMFWNKSLKREVQFQPSAVVGQPSPAVVLEPLGGGAPVSLATAVKGPVLINIFGSWCATCVEEHPILINIRDAGLPIIGVAWRDKPVNTAKFLATHGNPYAAVLMDPNGLAAIELGITAAPESYLVDANGTIVAKHGGMLTPAIADALVKKALGD